MRIHLDANILLDFYRENENALTLFDELDRWASQLIITEQVRDEFRRNRASVLEQLSKRFKDSYSAPGIYTVSVVRHMPAHAELVKARDAYKERAKVLADAIAQLATRPETDAVLTRFEALWRSPDVLRLVRSPEVIHRAQTRRLVGNPPSSAGRHSVGDEIIWELLLAWGADDLVIVSGDGGFLDNASFLQEEFRQRTGRHLIIVKKVSEGVKALGKTPSKALEEAEVKVHRLADDRWKITHVDGEMATVAKDGVVGRTPIGRNPDPSWVCATCGSYGPWNGSRCMSCGMMSDPWD